jgi:hypothetical protein
MRTYIFSYRQRMQKKYVLNETFNIIGHYINSSFIKKILFMEINNSFITLDVIIGNITNYQLVTDKMLEID